MSTTTETHPVQIAIANGVLQQASAAVPSTALTPIEIKQEGGRTVAYMRELAWGDVAEAKASALDGDTPEERELEMLRASTHRNDGKDDIRRAYIFWRKDELVYKCIKLLTQMSNSQLMIECEDDDFAGILRTWIDTALGHTFRDQWFREYFRSNFVVAVKALVPYVARDYKPGKIPHVDERNMVKAAKTQRLMDQQKADYEAYRAEANRLKQLREMHAQGLCSDERLHLQARIVIRRQHKWLKGMVPAAYSLLNPLNVEFKGPKELSLLRQPYLTVSEELREAVMNPTPAQADFVNCLPSEVVEQIRSGASEVWLSPNMCSIVTPDKQDYEVYPVPMIAHAFDALDQKQRLQAADKRTAESVKDRILKVTIGSDLHPVLNEEPIKKLAAIFSNPSRQMTIYWNHTLSIEWVEPPLDAFMDPKRYQLCDDRIRTCFGIGRTFTGTTDNGGSIGASIMNLAGLKEEIASAQESFIEFLMKEVHLLKQALGVGHEAKISFVAPLRDEAEFMAALQQMVQNGILDPQTAIETLGFHFPTVVARLKKSKKWREKDGIFLPLPSSNNMGPDGAVLQKGGTPTGGKPRNQPLADNNKNKRGKSQPKLKSKAAVQLMMPEENLVLAVIDADMIEDDARADVARAFGVATDRIVTRAEYKSRYGVDVKFLPSMPPLDNGEVLAISRQAVKLACKFDEKCEAAYEEWKSQNTPAGAKRGPYLTDKVKSEIRERVLATTLAPLDPANMTDLEREMFDTRFEGWVEELKSTGMEDDGERKINARLLTARQLQKYREMTAAAREAVAQVPQAA